jgi:hypothetical protein
MLVVVAVVVAVVGTMAAAAVWVLFLVVMFQVQVHQVLAEQE